MKKVRIFFILGRTRIRFSTKRIRNTDGYNVNTTKFRRYKLEQIQNHVWVKKKFKDPAEGVSSLTR